MVGIPPSLETDAEDVAWALQTAEALWKRNERVDAIVWLRRAAQAAGEANDDDRALLLAREAAELAEFIAHAPPEPASVTSMPPPVRQQIDDLLASSNEGSVDVPVQVGERPLPPEPVRDIEDTPVTNLASPAPPPPPNHGGRPAAEAHAGMLDPWAEPDAPTATGLPDGVWPELPLRSPSSTRGRSPEGAENEEVVTSAPPVVKPEARASGSPKVSARPGPAASAPPRPPPPPPAASRRAPPPLPPRARSKAPEPPPPPAPEPVAAEPPTPQPPPSPVPPVPPSGPTLVTPEQTPRMPEAASQAPSELPSVTERAALDAAMPLDLTDVDALSDLPDDAREAFARAARVIALHQDEEVSGFALALVVEGKVSVAATVVDARAQRMTAGEVLRCRGTIEDAVPMRLIGDGEATVATWDDVAVTQAFRTCPWVEDDLRAAADRVQALVGITVGPLGERLDAELRDRIMGGFKVRSLAGGEVVAKEGELVPGLIIVAVGVVEVVMADRVERTLGSGEFLFPSEVLAHAVAPATARAGAVGALVLEADRQLAQELMVTCPPLLELLGGM
jgi:hypothetical protein